ncbi:unnamed protein product [Rotaria magnacalcarata]|nr:unnamed protein product [Rotaria magnacalcarata]
MLVCNKSDLFQRHCDDDYRRIFLERAENFASLHQISIHYVSALKGDNISSMFKQLILRILQNELLLDQIKENSSLNGRSSIKLKRMRRVPATQVSLQSPSSSSTTQDECDRDSFRRRCC